MKPSSAATGKIELIASEIRSRVVRKFYPPGGRLPTRTELESEFAASSATVQRSLDTLIKDGFIAPRGRSGTFVPTLASVFLALRFWCSRASPTPGITGRTSGSPSPTPGPPWEGGAPASWSATTGSRDCGGYERAARLERDVTSHRYAGLIFASPPFYLEGTPIASVKGVPRVVVATTPIQGRGDVDYRA